MTTREIHGHLEDIYGVEVPPPLISAVAEAVIEDLKEWQSRPLEPLYPILFLDVLMVKMLHGSCWRVLGGENERWASIPIEAHRSVQLNE
jgi:transposase-like protein